MDYTVNIPTGKELVTIDKRRVKKPTTSAIIEALKTPKTYAEIAKEFGVTRQRVGYIAKQNGLARYTNLINDLKGKEQHEQTNP